MNKAKAIFLLVRLPFLTVTLGAVFLGTALAWWKTYHFNLGLFLLALGGACFLHLAGISAGCQNNYINEFCLFKYIKPINVGVI